MTEDEGAMADRMVRERFSNQNDEKETAMQGGGRIFQTERHRNELSMFCLQHLSGSLVMGSQVQGAGDEGSGQARRGVWIFFFVCVWLCFLTCEVLVFCQGSNLCPLQWLYRLLTSGLPGKPLDFIRRHWEADGKMWTV